MNSNSSVEELISRHFDEAVSATDLESLAARLSADPGAAQQFAQTARVHALLESLAPKKSVRRVPRWIVLGVAASLAVTGAETVRRLFPGKPLEAGQPGITDKNGGLLLHGKPLPPGVNLRRVKTFAASAPPAASLDELLARFYVHADPNGKSVPEAIRALETAIREADLLRRAELTDLRFTVRDRTGQGTTGQPGGAGSVIVSPLRPPLTIEQYLRICGLYGEITMMPGNVRFGKQIPQPEPGDGSQVTRVFRVAPDFLSTFNLPESEPQDPFGPHLEPPAVTSQSVLRDHYGITLNSPESVAFEPASAQLIVSALPGKLDRIEEVLEVFQNVRPVQHFVTVKFILCPAEALPGKFDAGTGMLLSDPEFQKFCRQLSVQPRVDLVTAPSIVVRPGQPSFIQLMQQVPGTESREPSGSDWLGLNQEVLTTSVGETIQVSGLVDFGLPAVSGMRALHAVFKDEMLPYTAEGIKHYQTGYDLWIPDRQTAVFTLDAAGTDDRLALVCLTAQVIDPAGKPMGGK